MLRSDARLGGRHGGRGAWPSRITGKLPACIKAQNEAVVSAGTTLEQGDREEGEHEMRRHMKDWRGT